MLTSVQNPLIKQLRKLHQVKYRRQMGAFLLEGTHLLQAAVAADWPLEAVCYSERWQHKEPQLLAQLQALDVRLETVSEAVLTSVAATSSPSGVVAIARSRAALNSGIQSLGLVVDAIQDPGNLGTILRTLAAVGGEGLLLGPGCVDLENPKLLRASAGAWFQVAAQPCAELLPRVRQYQAQGFQLVATSPHASHDYWSLDYTQPTLIAVGNEGAGLPPELLAAADHQVQIPLSAGVESLNAAIATAVMLYEVKRQRQSFSL